MKRSLQEVIELVVFGLIALLIGTGILWLLGWLLGIVSVVFTFLAGLIWTLLRFIIPIAIVAGVLFFIYKMFSREKPAPVVSATTASPVAEAKIERPHEVETQQSPEPPLETSGETSFPDEGKN
jgi:predicted lipid-binding transport protein (Tim44 family)